MASCQKKTVDNLHPEELEHHLSYTQGKEEVRGIQLVGTLDASKSKSAAAANRVDKQIKVMIRSDQDQDVEILHRPNGNRRIRR